MVEWRRNHTQYHRAMVSSHCERYAYLVLQFFLYECVLFFVVLNGISFYFSRSPRYRTVIEGSRREFLFPERFRGLSRKLSVVLLLPWVGVLWAIRWLMPGLPWVHRCFVSPIRYSFAEFQIVKHRIVETLARQRFAVRLARYEATIVKVREPAPRRPYFPRVTQRVLDHIGRIGFVVPHVPLTVGGVALRLNFQSGPVAIGLEPGVSIYGKWLSQQVIQHELVHVLQDLHLNIFARDWQGRLTSGQVFGLELIAQIYGSLLLLILVVVAISPVVLSFSLFFASWVLP